MSQKEFRIQPALQSTHLKLQTQRVDLVRGERVQKTKIIWKTKYSGIKCIIMLCALRHIQASASIPLCLHFNKYTRYPFGSHPACPRLAFLAFSFFFFLLNSVFGVNSNPEIIFLLFSIFSKISGIQTHPRIHCSLYRKTHQDSTFLLDM